MKTTARPNSPRAVCLEGGPSPCDPAATPLRGPDRQSESPLDGTPARDRRHATYAAQSRRQPALVRPLSDHIAVGRGSGEHTRTPGREPVLDRCAREQQRCRAHQLDRGPAIRIQCASVRRREHSPCARRSEGCEQAAQAKEQHDEEQLVLHIAGDQSRGVE